jgi:hypothetical protein
LRDILVALLSVALILAVACGGGDDSLSGSGGGDVAGAPTAESGGSNASGGGSGSAMQDACTMLSEAEVTAALSDDSIDTMKDASQNAQESVCQWDGTMTGNRYLYLTLRAAQNAAAVFESNYRSAGGAVSLPGIGDEAYGLPGVDTPNNYHFLTAAAITSSLYIQVNIAGPNRSDEEALSTLTMVMQQVVAKLQ